MFSDVPYEIRKMVEGEPVDFIVQSARDFVRHRLGVIMLIFLIPFLSVFLFPVMFMFPLLEILMTGRTSITVNGILQTFTRATIWTPLVFSLVPLIFSLIFIAPLWVVFSKAIQFIRRKGSWYAGTNTHLIEIDGSNTRYIPWSDIDDQVNIKNYPDGTADILMKLLPTGANASQSNLISQNTANMQAIVNGKPANHIMLSQFSFFNRDIGLLRIKNGPLVLNLIRHDIERYQKPQN